jgi:anion-transporting  ArsA/GET3 family ATPase
VPGELWAMMLDTEVMFDQVVRRNAATPEQAERIVDNRFYRNIAGSLSGTQEYMASEALHQLHGDGRFDLVVVDTPPSRNALDFLEAPGVLARFLDHRAFKLLMLPARGGLRVLNAAAQPILRAIGRVVGSDVLADAVAFFQSFAGREGGFRDRAKQVTELLRSERTRFVVVTAPRYEAVTEAAWFTEQLADQGVDSIVGVVNCVHPAFGSGSSGDACAAAGEADSDVAALWRNLAELRKLREDELDQLAAFTELFATGECTEVPLLAGDVHDREGLEHVAHNLLPSGSRGAAGSVGT